jgi:hypothetical protein
VLSGYLQNTLNNPKTMKTSIKELKKVLKKRVAQ